MASVGVRLFGRPAVIVDGTPRHLTARPLEVLTRLAVAAPEGVTSERVLSDVWGSSTTSDGAFRVAVNRIRSVIGHQHLRFDRGAYRLVDVDIDLVRFEREVARARRLVTDERADALQRALAVADAPAFDGLRDRAWIEPYAHRFDELREDAVDAWMESLEAIGRTGLHLPVLVAAFERAPIRERRCASVALALYRAGRQAEALRTIDRTRQILRDELGLHVGADVAELERRILRHDPGLAGQRRSDDQITVEAHIRAAQALAAVGAFDDARVLLDEAEQHASPDSRETALVELARARLAVVAGDATPGPHIERARRIARERRDGPLLARAALALIGSGVPEDRSAALVSLTEPLELLPRDAPERIDLLGAAAAFVVFIDGSEVMHQLLDEAERLQRDRDDPRTEVVVTVARSLVDSLDPSRSDRAAASAQTALAIARSLNDPRLVVAALQAAIRAWYRRGEIEEVAGVLDELERASTSGAFGFGQVRTELCRANDAATRGQLDEAERHVRAAERLGARLRTFAAEGAVRTLDVVLALERGEWDEVRAVGAAMEQRLGPSAWAGLVAWCGDDDLGEQLLTIGEQLPRDDSFHVFASLAAEVAARRHDAALGAWCERELSPLTGRTVVVGLGTAVLGFADHFRGMALAGMGDLDRAADRLTWSRDAARRVGAALWEAHSTVELAAVLADLGDHEAAWREIGAIPRTATTERVRRRARTVEGRLDRRDDAVSS